jgi:ribose/xylose/arabinose/galactoside ABC-type transport system permease subunit
LLVTKRNVSPFLATLATMIVLQGFRFAATQGAPSGNVPPIYRLLGSAKLYGVPYNLMVMLAMAAIFAVLLHKAAFGRRVFITGGNPVTARLVGISADRVIIACYMISGSLAALAARLDRRRGNGWRCPVRRTRDDPRSTRRGCHSRRPVECGGDDRHARAAADHR